MHGMILTELRNYVKTKLGDQAWSDLLAKAGMGPKLYVPFEAYPDKDVVTLVTTASEMTGLPVPVILEDFGEYLVPYLLSKYQDLIPPDWRTLDVIEHAENEIHTAVRKLNAGADPPQLVCKRLGPNELLLTYSSHRQM